MTPDCRAWTERMADQWGARAAARREAGRPADLAIARMLQMIVDDHRQRLAAAPTVDPTIAALESRLASIEPRPGPYGLVINGGEIMDRVRHTFLCRLAAARGQPEPPPLVAGPPPDPPPEPPPEALPFTSGPQLDFFAC